MTCKHTAESALKLIMKFEIPRKWNWIGWSSQRIAIGWRTL